MIGEAGGSENITALLTLEVFGAEYLIVGEAKMIPLINQTWLKVAHKQVFINGMAFGKGIAAKEDITQQCPERFPT